MIQGFIEEMLFYLTIPMTCLGFTGGVAVDGVCFGLCWFWLQPLYNSIMSYKHRDDLLINKAFIVLIASCATGMLCFVIVSCLAPIALMPIARWTCPLSYR